MPDLRFPHFNDFRDWCKEHMSDIMERLLLIDESIESEDMEVGNVYILSRRAGRSSYTRFTNEAMHLIYIIDKSPSSRYYWNRIILKWGMHSGRGEKVNRSIGVGEAMSEAKAWSNRYFIIPVSSNDFSFINWTDDPFTVK